MGLLELGALLGGFGQHLLASFGGCPLRIGVLVATELLEDAPAAQPVAARQGEIAGHHRALEGLGLVDDPEVGNRGLATLQVEGLHVLGQGPLAFVVPGRPRDDAQMTQVGRLQGHGVGEGERGLQGLLLSLLEVR